MKEFIQNQIIKWEGPDGYLVPLILKSSAVHTVVHPQSHLWILFLNSFLCAVFQLLDFDFFHSVNSTNNGLRELSQYQRRERT